MRQYFLGLVLFTFSFNSFAKTDSTVIPQVRFSPTQIANLKTQTGNYFKITYGQPMKKGRDIFGSLVPYGEVWRLGANEATEMTVSTDFEIAGTRFKAGTYTIFAIPFEKDWTIIFNSVLGQWGAFKYDEKFDVLRVNIPVEKEETIYEGLTFELTDVSDNNVMLSIKWDDAMANIPIKTIKQTIVQPVSTKKKRKTKKR